jgi:hypothetical protein
MAGEIGGDSNSDGAACLFRSCGRGRAYMEVASGGGSSSSDRAACLPRTEATPSAHIHPIPAKNVRTGGRDCVESEIGGVNSINVAACLFRLWERGRVCVGRASGGGNNIDAAACFSRTRVGGRDCAEGELDSDSDIDGAACLSRSGWRERV